MMWGVTLSKDKYAVIAWSRSSLFVALEALEALRTVSHKCWWVMLANSPAFYSRDFLRLLMLLRFCLQAPWGSPLHRAKCSRCSALMQPMLWLMASFCPVMKLCWKVLSISLVLTNQVINWLFLFLLLFLQARIFLWMDFMLAKTSDPTNASSEMTLHLINNEQF